MFENIIKDIRIICELSKKREEEYRIKHKEDEFKTLGEKMDKMLDAMEEGLTGAEKQLYEYMHKLDFETIKIIQVIMYIGRDGSDEVDPTAIYDKQRHDFDKDGWNTKEIETQQILQKMPLHIYLLKGCEMLQIQL